MMEPFSPATITAGVVTNIATDILKHHAQGLDNTLAGRLLKRTGLIEPGFDDRLRDTLIKTLKLYFETYPRYQFASIITFFHDPTVARQIGNHILDGQPVDETRIQTALQRHLKQDVTSILLQQWNLDPQQIVPDFLKCYRRVLNQQLTIPQIGLLLEIVNQTDKLTTEIRESEVRLEQKIAALLDKKLSPVALQHAYQIEQQELATDLVEEMDDAGMVQPDQAVQTIRSRLEPRPALFNSGLCRGHPLSPTPDQYFVSHGLDSHTLADWRETLAAALAKAAGANQPLRPYFAGDTLLGGYRLCGISEKICASRFSLFLLPASQDRNVYLELGIAVGLGTPFFLIQHYKAEIPSLLAGLGRYVKGGLFRRMRRELPDQIEEYDFGVVRFTADLPSAGSQATYLLAAGDMIDDEDFEASVSEGIGEAYPHLIATSLTEQLGSADQPGWALEQLVRTIQTSRFAIYRVDEDCSPTTFLALGISIGLNRPFLMICQTSREVPEDIRGITLYQFPNFVTLRREFVPRHRSFLQKYAE